MLTIVQFAVEELCVCSLVKLNSTQAYGRRKSRSIQLPVTVQGSNSKFNPLAAKLTDKNMSSVSVNSV